MKLYKIGQPWQNEPLIENKTEFIDNNQARFACQERKISNPKPRTREGCPILSNFSFGAYKVWSQAPDTAPHESELSTKLDIYTQICYHKYNI
jgi:hypothetical protein